VGHGTASSDQLVERLRGAGVTDLVDIRSVPASRHHPQFGRHEMAAWLPPAGIGYGWEPALGGFRTGVPSSANVALRHPAFRAYADYMETAAFTAALRQLLQQARERRVAVMCAETLWWRCHRRLVADAAVLLGGAAVQHLMPGGGRPEHGVTAGVRVGPHGHLVYDGAPAARALPLEGGVDGSAEDGGQGGAVGG